MIVSLLRAFLFWLEAERLRAEEERERAERARRRRRTLDQAIAELRAAMRRTNDEMDALTAEWRARGAMCCPGCMAPDRWSALVEKENRQRAALRMLDRRRARRACQQLTAELRAASRAI